MKKNIKAGKINLYIFFIILIFTFNSLFNQSLANNLEGNFTEIKVLDKISSKKTLVKLKNGEEMKHKDLSIKSIKCKNSEFDDDPEIIAYIQVKDLKVKIKMMFLYLMDWMFSSSPSIAPFDHPVYDIWLVKCY